MGFKILMFILLLFFVHTITIFIRFVSDKSLNKKISFFVSPLFVLLTYLIFVYSILSKPTTIIKSLVFYLFKFPQISVLISEGIMEAKVQMKARKKLNLTSEIHDIDFVTMGKGVKNLIYN